MSTSYPLNLPDSETDRALEPVFGLTLQQLESVMSVTGNVPTAFLNRLVAFLEVCGAIELIEQWQNDDRKATSGRKPTIPPRAILLALLLNGLWGLGWSYTELAKTLVYRLTYKQRQALGIIDDGANLDTWYDRAWRANKRILKLIDPWHQTSLKKKLTGAEFERAEKLYEENKDREQRAHELARLLTSGSVRILPDEYLQSYRGDVALDSTALIVQGRNNPKQKDKNGNERKRLNGDFQCGWYTRLDDHDGRKVAKSQPAYELDTTVLIDAKTGAYTFPLISGINLHLPGQLKKGPKNTVDQHAALFEKRGVVVVDRAFNNLTPTDFQEPVRRHRFETAYDYKINQLGPQGSVADKPIIIVDGSLYVNLMPLSYRMISRWYEEAQKLPSEQIEAAITAAKAQNPGAILDRVDIKHRENGKNRITTVRLDPLTERPYTKVKRPGFRSASYAGASALARVS